MIISFIKGKKLSKPTWPYVKNEFLDWSDNTVQVYKKGQSRIHLLRRLRSFGVCQALLKTFYDSVVSSVILYAVTCWGGGLLEKEKNKLNKLIKRQVLWWVACCPLLM